jgi:hypothetical protein
MSSTIPFAESEADTKAVIEHAMTGKPLDPAVAKRIREEA